MVVVLGLVAWSRLGPDEDGDDAGANKDTPGDTGKGEPGDDDEELSLDQIDDRYADLAAAVTSGMTQCEAADPAPGVEEQLSCTSADGTLDLTTFAASEDLEAARSRTLDTREGSLVEVTTGRAFYSFDPSHTDTADPAEVYWDSTVSAQSAHLVGRSLAGEYEQLIAQFDSTTPAIEMPTVPGSPRLIRFLSENRVTACERINTYADGEIEENLCEIDGYDVFAATFRTTDDFLRYRDEATTAQRQSGVYDGAQVFCFSFDRDPVCGSDPREEVIGQIRGFTRGKGARSTGVVYVDDEQCRCYFEVEGGAGTGTTDPGWLLDVVFAQ
jgi:hypothetical protein